MKIFKNMMWKSSGDFFAKCVEHSMTLGDLQYFARDLG
jgi:hypothetical protein